jgi:membrane-bound serine protease (ClpP class)
MKFCVWLTLSFAFISFSLYADFVVLEGFLGKAQLEQAEKQVAEASNAGEAQIVIQINSSSGDLRGVLELAKKIYALKEEKGTRVIVYLDQNAIGPAGILPFLADELYSSYFVSWGDIPLNSEDTLSTNILRNSVISLIRPGHPHYPILSLMASAMTDPSVKVSDQNGWKIGDSGPLVFSENETLVVNHHQLQRLDLIKEVVPLTAFKKLFMDEKAGEDQAARAETFEAKGINEKLAKYIRYDADEPNTVGLINIDQKTTQISQATWIYVKNALDYYKKQKPRFIILQLNTPGGEVFASQKISDALKEIDTQNDIPVVAFINNWAISAGAMLAYSCRFIAVVKDASMGAAEPVMVGEGGKMESASEKINSALRADFANRAGFFDRNPNIAEAMVDKDMILVFRHGEVVRLDNEDKIRRRGPDPDVVISAKGKLLTLSADEMIRYGVADLELSPSRTSPITSEESTKGKWPASKMLLFQEPFFEKIPSAVIDEFQMDWKTRFLALISSPVVASLLFLGMMFGFYVEINSPGFGFPGSIGLLCLSLMILSSFALEVANMLELVFLLLGLVFLALDVFLIPTFGILGIVGVVFFFVGLFGLMLPGIGTVAFEWDTKTFNAAGEVFIQRLAWLCGSLVVSVIGMGLLGKYVMPTFGGFQPFILAGNEENREDGYIAGADPRTLPQPGMRGEVLSSLRPAGKVLIDQEIYDAITIGGYIDKGEQIKVIKLDGSVIVVGKSKLEE